MENNRYRNINELLNEIEELGDWRDVSQRDKFFKVLSKITVIYHGYEIEDENEKKSNGWYPDEVMQAIVKACKSKFPTKGQVFDKDGNIKSGYPDYSNYLVLVNDAIGISLMGERTRIDEIAKNEFGIDVYHTPATKEDVEEMVQSSKEYYEKVVNEERQNAVPIEFFGSTLDECVESLLKFQKRGESVVVEFNGHKLYSTDISMDRAYQEVLGMTQKRYEQKMEEWHKEHQEREAREKAEAKDKIPDWIEKGKEFIYPERMEKWINCVEARSRDLYHGMELDSALALMKKLESGATMKEAKEMFNEQGHSEAGAGMVRRILFHFAKRGPEFYESTALRELSEEDKKLIQDKKRENAELEELHKTASTKEVPAERRAEEKEIVDSLSEKAQLTSEIDNIEQQLKEVRAKDAELKKDLEEKKSKLNELEEK